MRSTALGPRRDRGRCLRWRGPRPCSGVCPTRSTKPSCPVESRMRSTCSQTRWAAWQGRSRISGIAHDARRRSETSSAALLHLENRVERFLGDLHAADVLHPLLALFLLLEELSFARDVA